MMAIVDTADDTSFTSHDKQKFGFVIVVQEHVVMSQHVFALKYDILFVVASIAILFNLGSLLHLMLSLYNFLHVVIVFYMSFTAKE